MHIEHLNHWSGELGREMLLNRYGHSGMPILVFPSSGGTHFEYYDFGIIDVCHDFIESGKVQFFTLASIDSESWLHDSKPAHDRALAHEAYDRYVISEVIPFIKHKTGWFDSMMTTGCSMGAYHALNFLETSGCLPNNRCTQRCLRCTFLFGDYGNDPLVYENSPSDYIWNQNDGWFIDRYRSADIIICTGRGDWEQDGLPSYFTLKEAFEEKQIPAWFDEWGEDVSHDWAWWRCQMPYYLGKLL